MFLAVVLTCPPEPLCQSLVPLWRSAGSLPASLSTQPHPTGSQGAQVCAYHLAPYTEIFATLISYPNLSLKTAWRRFAFPIPSNHAQHPSAPTYTTAAGVLCEAGSRILPVPGTERCWQGKMNHAATEQAGYVLLATLVSHPGTTTLCQTVSVNLHDKYQWPTASEILLKCLEIIGILRKKKKEKEKKLIPSTQANLYRSYILSTTDVP